jgi:molybdate transport system permease protein
LWVLALSFPASNVELAPLVLSLKVATIATVIAAVIGIAIAAFLANARFFGRDLVDVLVTAPVVLPPTVLGYYLLVAIGRRSAVGHAFETAFGTSIVFTQTGAVVAATVGAMPLVVKSSRGETQTASLAIYDSIQGHHDNAALGLVIALAIVAMTILYISNKLVRIRHVR